MTYQRNDSHQVWVDEPMRLTVSYRSKALVGAREQVTCRGVGNVWAVTPLKKCLYFPGLWVPICTWWTTFHDTFIAKVWRPCHVQTWRFTSFFPFPGLTSCLLDVCQSWQEWECGSEWLIKVSHLGLGTQSLIAIDLKLFSFVPTAALCKKKFLWPRLRAAQAYGYTHEYLEGNLIKLLKTGGEARWHNTCTTA